MAGGLVQLAVYGTQDIFLTSTPQITFFKIVYRRHTNFATEPIAQHFIGATNFDQEMTCVVDKLGDLMNRVYLEIDLPNVDLLKNPSNWKINQTDAKNRFEQIQKYYQMVYNYISVNSNLIRKIDTLLKINNVSMDDIEKIVNNPNFINCLITLRCELKDYIKNNNNFNSIDEFQKNKYDTEQQINQIDIQMVFNSIINDTNHLKNVIPQELAVIKRNRIKNFITTMLYQSMKNFYMDVYNLYLTEQKLYQSFLDGTYSEHYKFAWVEEIGHAIIDQIEIRIGNQIIDKHTGDWLILFNKIFLHEYQCENYYKMIGNVSELTNFDDRVKSAYKLIIPLQFWFCRHTGLSLPLVALRYHDVVFNIKLKDLSKLCYIEDDPNLMDIANVQSQFNINIINAKLYVDYIFLDTDERRRFAQSTHEYLIETIQQNEFDNITGKQYSAHLNFAHPTKFIVWFVQPKHYRENPTGRNKCQWNNFGTNHDKTGYPIESSYIRLNSCNRTDPHIDIKYFNYLQPYLHFNSSPTDGFNVYSFAIKPMEHQPSSTINLSRIDDLTIILMFGNDFIDLVNNGNVDDVEIGIYMTSYVMSYNIFRVIGGMAGLAFQNTI